MKAEIIAIGSELLTPDSIDTNSLYLTRTLNASGCDVHLKTIVGDDQQNIEGVLRQALERSDLIIFSGGLGPTMDDLTRTAVSSVLEQPLVRNEKFLEELRGKFALRGFPMSPNNERQAEIIQGADLLDNPWGTDILSCSPAPPGSFVPFSKIMPSRASASFLEIHRWRTGRSLLRE